MGLDRRDCVVQLYFRVNQTGGGTRWIDKAKPFIISKWEVWEAYKRVKANKGAAGLDGQSIAVFEEVLKNNLFTIWNRMSSGNRKYTKTGSLESILPGNSA